MTLRPVPAGTLWFFRLLSLGHFLRHGSWSNPEQEPVIGDLLEQYQRGRGGFWFWHQAAGLICFEVFRTARRSVAEIRWGSLSRGLTLALLLAGLSAVLLSDIWLLFVAALAGGLMTGVVSVAWSHGPQTPVVSDTSGSPRPHPGISMHRIPAEGTVGFLFAIGTVLIFGSIGAIREVLLVTLPIGLLAAGVLTYRHHRHPVELQGTGLGEGKESLNGSGRRLGR